MELLDDVRHVESCFDLLETVLVSVQDRCTNSAKHTIGLEIILNTTDGSPRWRGSQVDACFNSLGYSVCVGAR
jgi:hypothetical protein